MSYDNARYISPSEIASMDCWRAYRWKRAGIRPRRQPKALNAGTAWDAFMGEWFRPVGRFGDMLSDLRTIDDRLVHGIEAAKSKINEAAKAADASFIQLYGEGSAEVEAERLEIETLIVGMAEHFASTYIEDKHGVCRAVQVRVNSPLPSQSGSGMSNKFRLHGWIDRIMERDGKVVIIDDKSTSSIDDTFFDDFENDLQMPLYAYGLPKSQSWIDLGLSRQDSIDEIGVFAAAKKVPVVPPMRKTPFPVYATNGIGEIIMEMVEGEMKPVQLTEPVPCADCEGAKVEIAGREPDGSPCVRCEGEGVERYRPTAVLDDLGDEVLEQILDENNQVVVYASGARKGEVKTRKMMRPGDVKTRKVTRHGLSSLLSGSGELNYTTATAHFRTAIEENGLDPADYRRELDYLLEQGVKPFFQYAIVPVTPTTIQEAAEVLRAVAPLLDKVPDAPMRNKFRCRRCSFQKACVVANPEARADVIKTFYSTREERKEVEEAAAAT